MMFRFFLTLITISLSFDGYSQQTNNLDFTYLVFKKKSRYKFVFDQKQLVELGNTGNVILTSYIATDSIRIQGISFTNGVYVCNPFTIYAASKKKGKLQDIVKLRENDKLSLGKFSISLPKDCLNRFIIFDYQGVKPFGFCVKDIVFTEPYWCPELVTARKQICK